MKKPKRTNSVLSKLSTFKNSGDSVFIYTQPDEGDRQVSLGKLTSDGLVLRIVTQKEDAVFVKKDHQADRFSGLAFCQTGGWCRLPPNPFQPVWSLVAIARAAGKL